MCLIEYYEAIKMLIFADYWKISMLSSLLKCDTWLCDQHSYKLTQSWASWNKKEKMHQSFSNSLVRWQDFIFQVSPYLAMSNDVSRIIIQKNAQTENMTHIFLFISF